jgi:uncharacterized protein (TIGR03435 family)
MSASLVGLILAKVTVTTVIGLTVVHVSRRSRAARRHVLLAATLAVAIMLPAASIVVPPISIAVPVARASRPPSPSGSEASADSGVVPSASSAVTSGSAVAAGASRSGSWTASSSALLLTAWMAGAATCLAPLLVGLGQARSLRRTGIPWCHGQSVADAVARDTGIGRRVVVLLHEAAPGPLTFGIVRPVIVLPIDVEGWRDEDLRRSLLHELEHVRRGDWLTQSLARVVCALYWVHPLPWLAARQIGLEAERACDDAVLRRSEATAYADQLVALARRLSAARQPLIAMANRADLSTRVGAVLDANQPRGRAGTRWIAVVSGAAIAVAGLLSPFRIVAAQQMAAPGAAKQRYDVATVKPCVAEQVPTGARGTYGGTNASFSPGRFSVPCVTTGQLIYLAYAAAGVPESERLIHDDPGTAASPQKVRGGPDWVHSLRDKYAVEAAADGVTERTVLMGTMLRTLLEERFQLKIHRETEDVAMFALIVAKGGLKITPMKDGDCAPYDGMPIDFNAPKPTCGNLTMTGVEGRTRWVFGGTTLKNLAAMLSRPLGVHIIDRTNVTDQFIVRLEFQREGRIGSDVTGRDAADALPDAPPISTALEEQLGLKLEKTRGPRGFLVIDHIERPKPDLPATASPVRASGAGPRSR